VRAYRSESSIGAFKVATEPRSQATVEAAWYGRPWRGWDDAVRVAVTCGHRGGLWGTPRCRDGHPLVKDSAPGGVVNAFRPWWRFRSFFAGGQASLIPVEWRPSMTERGAS
jgi:hypothetical protein